jgi:hypothetical protein
MTLCGCGPASKRDLSNIPQREITFNDLCHLQDYFDQRNAAGHSQFRSRNEQISETAETEPDEFGQASRRITGSGEYIVTQRSSQRRLRRLLDEEYVRLPALQISPGERVILRVEWWQSGRIRRLRPDRDIEVQTRQGSYRLPFNPCVGEFLFGAEAYAMRRYALESEAARARGDDPPPMPDFSRIAPDPDARRQRRDSAPDGGRSDAENHESLPSTSSEPHPDR